jgi:hypothetical protein
MSTARPYQLRPRRAITPSATIAGISERETVHGFVAVCRAMSALRHRRMLVDESS